jgi:hypothetical protein
MAEGDRSCGKCAHQREGRCYHPTMTKVSYYADGIVVKDARMPGRFCGPRGEAFIPTRLATVG